MSQYFTKPCELFGGDTYVKVDWSNYATKADLNNKIDKIDVGKSKSVPVDLSKLSYVVDNDVVKKLCMIN